MTKTQKLKLELRAKEWLENFKGSTLGGGTSLVQDLYDAMLDVWEEKQELRAQVDMLTYDNEDE